MINVRSLTSKHMNRTTAKETIQIKKKLNKTTRKNKDEHINSKRKRKIMNIEHNMLKIRS